MLGGAILLIVVVLFFGIRAFMGSGKGDSSKDTADEQVTADNDQGNVPSSPDGSSQNLLPAFRFRSLLQAGNPWTSSQYSPLWRHVPGSHHLQVKFDT